ncbi:MAG: aldo/keto reductase [Planctomycetota bacterium]|jgi:aryl-alcohol dehydrogenase-like predicted oxidoreductase
MEYRKIADGKLEVSTVCIGCWAIVGDATWGAQDKSDAIAAIRTAVDEGVTFFDTAEGYGAGYSEQLLCEALGADRDRIVIGSKVSRSHLGARELPEACEQSLKRLGTDYIDLYHIHWPSRTIPFDETVRAMEGLIESGKVRYLAVSNFGPGDLADLLPLATPVVNQMAYSLLFRAVEHQALPVNRDAGVPLTCYCPLMQGLLTGKFASADDVPAGRARTRLFSKDRPEVRHGEDGAEAETFAAVAAIAAVAAQAGLDMAAMSLAWVIRREAVASVIVGSRSAAQSRANAAAGDLKLSPDLTRRLDEITQPLMDRLGPNLDLWQAQSRLW